MPRHVRHALCRQFGHEVLGQCRRPLVVANATQEFSTQGKQIDEITPQETRDLLLHGTPFEPLDLRLQVAQAMVPSVVRMAVAVAGTSCRPAITGSSIGVCLSECRAERGRWFDGKTSAGLPGGLKFGGCRYGKVAEAGTVA